MPAQGRDMIGDNPGNEDFRGLETIDKLKPLIN
jgi:hypothetical protein